MKTATWEIENNKLVKRYEFASQTELCQFLLEVAKCADNFYHHPDVVIYQCSKMSISLFTHDKGQITEKDHELSKRIDAISHLSTKL